MRELVRRGAHVHPGAVAVEEENGRILSLTNMDQAERDSVAISLCSPSEAAIRSITNKNGGGKLKTLFKPKIVHRHLHDGDLLLMNRQPTLHKPSIMGFEARVSFEYKLLTRCKTVLVKYLLLSNLKMNHLIFKKDVCFSSLFGFRCCTERKQCGCTTPTASLSMPISMVTK